MRWGKKAKSKSDKVFIFYILRINIIRVDLNNLNVRSKAAPWRVISKNRTIIIKYQSSCEPTRKLMRVDVK